MRTCVLIAAASLLALHPQCAEAATAVKSVSVGSVFTCAVLQYDQVKCFGRGSYGHLGYGNTANIGDASNELGDNLPLVDLAFGSVASVASGTDHVCALSTAGAVKCWGYGYNGELGLELSSAMLGDNAGEMGSNLPTVNLGTGRTATAIAAGDGHTCAILDNGSLKCWGYGGDGRLGQGSPSSIGSNVGSMGDNLAAINLGTGRTALKVATGDEHTCAILDNNDLKCFGKGSYGRLGSGATLNLGDSALEMGDNLLPVNLGTGRYAVKVATGNEHTCVILDNASVKCFGRNDKGQLGIDSTTTKGTSAADMGDSLSTVNLGVGRTATEIACGQKVSCALLDNGEVKCWGQAAYGQLMKGSSTANLGDASGEMAALTSLNFGTRSSSIIAISLGVGGLYGHACAIYSTSSPSYGTLMCWGSGTFGQLGNGAPLVYGETSGETGSSIAPVDVDLGSVLTSAPTSPTTTLSPTFGVPTLTPTTSAPSLSPTLRPTKSPTFSAPTRSPIVRPKVNKVAVGGESTCVILENDQLRCFGRGSYGRLGNGDTQNLGDTLNEMENLPDVDLDFIGVKDVDIGTNHACAISTINELKCWGYGYNGELGLAISSAIIGDNSGEMGSNLPTVNVGTGELVEKVSCGDGFTCVLLLSGNVKCWGYGGNGQLGQGSYSSIGSDTNSMGDNLTAIDLGTGLTALEISAGASHVCAILSDSSLKCWGSGAYGQLGSGSTNDIGDDPFEMGDNLTQVDLGAGRNALGVAAGGYHTCVLLDDLTVKCFGRNDQGQLGLGDTTNRGTTLASMGNNLPTVTLGSGVSAIAAGDKVSCALIDDGTIKCWGDGYFGQLMKGNQNDIGDSAGEMTSLLPLDIGSDSSAFVSIALGTGGLYGHACAIYFPGNAVCWGNGAFGQRGTGNNLVYGDTLGETGGSPDPLLVITGP